MIWMQFDTEFISNVLTNSLKIIISALLKKRGPVKILQKTGESSLSDYF